MAEVAQEQRASILRPPTVSCYNGVMQPLLDNDPARQQARTFSAQLGTLAGQNATAPAMPTRLAAILQDLKARNRAREDLQAKINATHFIMAD